MKRSELKRKIERIVELLPEKKLEIVIDFATGLVNDEDRHISEMQTNSNAYKEWINSENDIYDELFRNETKER